MSKDSTSRTDCLFHHNAQFKTDLTVVTIGKAKASNKVRHERKRKNQEEMSSSDKETQKLYFTQGYKYLPLKETIRKELASRIDSFILRLHLPTFLFFHLSF